MATQIDEAFLSISKLNLWFKVRDNKDLKLSDIPELIPNRWAYFKTEWNNVRSRYVNMVASYYDQDRFKSDIRNFTLFIDNQSYIGSNPFTDKDVLFRFYSIFDNTSVFDLQLTSDEISTINRNIDHVNRYVRKDFIALKNSIISARNYIADTTSTSDDDYNKIFGRKSIEGLIDLGIKNLNLMAYFQSTIKSIDFILANIFSLDTIYVDPFALAKINANNPNIDITTYNSGRLVRFNYGENLQDIAGRELGDRDKWIDIAIANGLKPPYIDEIGQKIPLLSNADGNQINISAYTGTIVNIDRLFINQVILIKSNSYPSPEQRMVRNIRQAPISGEIIIELDGAKDLDRYKTSDDAYIRVFKSNTINSSFMILIPSTEDIPDDIKQDTPWFLMGSSESEKRQKVDLMISEAGDLVFTPKDDLQLSFGLENAIQAIKLKMSIEAGEIKRHPEFGINSVAGFSNLDVSSLEEILIKTISDTIKDDPRFDRIERLDVTYTQENMVNSFNVRLAVRLSGSDSVIPITFNVSV